jgi:RNA polymerase sigma-70 factor (ECF subfamily)
MELDRDETLVERFAGEGDGRALETLFRRHMDRVYRLARRYFAVREDAEEVVSESFLRCFRALGDGQFRGNSLFRTWLATITVNVCLERLRQPRLPTLLLDTIEHMAGPGSLGGGEVMAALEKLPDDQRLAIILCDLEGYDAKEAAEIVGRGLTALKSLHYRGRRSLRDILEREKHEFDGV